MSVGSLLTLAVSRRQVGPPKRSQPPVIDFAYFQTLLYKWTRAHGPPPRMLPEGGRLRPAIKAAASPDVLQYSFDRLLVVDRAETADLLLANNLHFETSMPVVTIDGYPQGAFQNVLMMVRRNPGLKIYTLHDASPEGCLLPLRLREEKVWFPQPATSVIDQGLRPSQIAGQPQLIVQQVERQENLPPALLRLLSPGERHWLQTGHRCELANYRPAALLRIVYRILQKTAEEEDRLKAYAAQDPRGYFQTRWTSLNEAVQSSSVGSQIYVADRDMPPDTASPDAGKRPS